MVIEQLTDALSQRHQVHITDPECTPAGVLVPIFIRQGHYHILFIQRTNKVRDHKGQISFPGGAYEKEDVVLRNTALREAEEEIGLKRNDVRILGQLDDMATAGTHYIISPFVGVIPCPYPFKVDEFETEEIIEVPLEALLAKDGCETGMTMVGDTPTETYFYHYNGRTIWGATARILKQLLEIISDLAEKGAPLETD